VHAVSIGKRLIEKTFFAGSEWSAWGCRPSVAMAAKT
jgi:hypothetical protein